MAQSRDLTRTRHRFADYGDRCAWEVLRFAGPPSRAGMQGSLLCAARSGVSVLASDCPVVVLDVVCLCFVFVQRAALGNTRCIRRSDAVAELQTA